jgi:hypothetical protein
MVEAAKKGAMAQGYTLQRLPGRGLSNIWTITKDGKSQRASIRTTRDRWIAFPPLDKGKKWRTLDEVEAVIVASVDSREEPENVEVYIFPADEVRKRFHAAYTARINDGQKVRDNFGMWVGLDRDERGIAASVGSGITEKFKHVAVYAIEDLLAENADKLAAAEESAGEAETLETVEAAAPRLTTIAEVMAWAREQLAEIAGVKLDAIKLDLRIEY